MIDTILMYLDFAYVRYALIVGVLIALCSSLLGVTLVLRRFSFIGDGLSHVAFGAMTVAAVVGLTNDMLLVLPVTILCAILLLAAGTNARIKGDAAVAMISVGALAIGYLLMNLFPPSGKANISGDVCTTLFGGTSILTLKAAEVWLSIALSVVVVVFPALSAMRVFKSFRSVSICAAGISVLCAAAGFLVAAAVGTPVGSTIVVADIAVFALFSLAGLLRGRV